MRLGGILRGKSTAYQNWRIFLLPTPSGMRVTCASDVPSSNHRKLENATEVMEARWVFPQHDGPVNEAPIS